MKFNSDISQRKWRKQERNIKVVQVLATWLLYSVSRDKWFLHFSSITLSQYNKYIYTKHIYIYTYTYIHTHIQIHIIIIQFWFGFIPVNGGGRIYPTLTAISPTPILNLAWFKTSSFSKPIFLLSFSTYVFQDIVYNYYIGKQKMHVCVYV